MSKNAHLLLAEEAPRASGLDHLRTVAPQECPFCNDWIDASASPFDTFLRQSPIVNLMPALGMLAPGYLLATTTEHLLSTAYLGAAGLAALANEVDALVGELADTFGPYLTFEHGSCPESGSCIEHAHVHLIPAADELRQIILTSRRWRKLGTIADLADLAGTEYGLLQIDGDYFVDTEPFPSQWIRQVVAGFVGAPVWDWALDSGWANLKTTKYALAATTARGSSEGCGV